MGDMIRCGKCGTHHYRNDPCPDELRYQSTGREIDHSGLDVPRATGSVCVNLFGGPEDGRCITVPRATLIRQCGRLLVPVKPAPVIGDYCPYKRISASVYESRDGTSDLFYVGSA